MKTMAYYFLSDTQEAQVLQAGSFQSLPRTQEQKNKQLCVERELGLGCPP